MREFATAAMDSQTKIFTIIFTAICLALPLCFYFGMQDSDLPVAAVVLPLAVMAAAGVLSYLLIPKIYVDFSKICIKNYFVNINIPISDVVGIKKFERVGPNIRTFGVGGFFGYFGYFNGNDVWYVTNIHKKVKIQTSGKLYIISPEEPEKFIEEIKRLQQNIRQS